MFVACLNDYDLLTKCMNTVHRIIRLKILLHLEFLSDALGDNIFETHVSKGGPLGELVQWTDLITALYILGH
ncbi:hypothetical protein Smp_102430, partial [Schistosoma mansoni]|uniref:hypothetical protein n=1 Tax=Schistosoma mansoni TaxID=6183 RepID=UPI00022DC542